MHERVLILAGRGTFVKDGTVARLAGKSLVSEALATPA
jgi:hypothetical protein